MTSSVPPISVSTLTHSGEPVVPRRRIERRSFTSNPRPSSLTMKCNLGGSVFKLDDEVLCPGVLLHIMDGLLPDAQDFALLPGGMGR